MRKTRGKETYFSPDTLRAKSAEMLQAVSPYARNPESRFAPERCALLVLDMQRFFFEEASHAFVPSAPAIVPGINELSHAFSRRGRPVVFTRHVNSPRDAGRMASWWRELIEEDGPLSRTIDALDLSGGIVLIKHQYDAFYETGLADVLRQRGVEQVVICGVLTHLCCESTARSAFVHGFEVFFSVDGTATYTEAFHRATLLNLSHGFAVPALVENLLADVRADDGG